MIQKLIAAAMLQVQMRVNTRGSLLPAPAPATGPWTQHQPQPGSTYTPQTNVYNPYPPPPPYTTSPGFPNTLPAGHQFTPQNTTPGDTNQQQFIYGQTNEPYAQMTHPQAYQQSLGQQQIIAQQQPPSHQPQNVAQGPPGRAPVGTANPAVTNLAQPQTQQLNTAQKKADPSEEQQPNPEGGDAEGTAQI